MIQLILLLVGCGPTAEDIATAIGSDNPVMREDGAKISQNFDDPAVIEALLKIINDPSDKVRLNTIESLAELETPGMLPVLGDPSELYPKVKEALIDRLKNDPNPLVRRAAADALGRLLAKEAIPDLIAYLDTFESNDPDQLVAIWAIGFIGAEGLEAEAKKAALECLVRHRDGTTDKYIYYQATAALRFLK